MRVPREKVRKQLQLLAQVERLGDRVTQAFVKDFNRKALAALRRRATVRLTAAEKKKITDELADLMLLGFVRRYRQKKNALGIELNMSFSREVAKIARGFDLDLGKIRKSFVTMATGRVDESVASIETRINAAIGDITAKQQPTAIATAKLRRRLDEMGLTARRPSIVETLVRTHAQMSFGAAQYQLDQDDPHDVITGYLYSTVGDDRVRDSHAAMDGVVFAKDDPRLETWWPPNGYNCRCQLIELTEPIKASASPGGVSPDEGFAFNPGRLLAA